MDTTTNKYVKEVDYKQLIKVNCPCGGKHSLAGKSKHLKTKIHGEYMMSKYLASAERYKNNHPTEEVITNQ